MAFMNWSDAYSIGVPVFDEEHKRLFKMINDLYETVDAGSEDVALWNIVCELVDYTATHLLHEELYFFECNYPEAERHVSEHAELRRQAFAFRNRININPSPEAAAGLLLYLRDWQVRHMMDEDKKFGAYLCAHGYAGKVRALTG